MNRFRIDRGEKHLILPKHLLSPDDRRWLSRKLDPRKYNKYSLNVPTPDDWHPTLSDGTVEVSVILTTAVWGHPSIRTCVWGGDDDGMERDELFDSNQDAEDAYIRRVKEVEGWAIVTRDMLSALGFVPV